MVSAGLLVLLRGSWLPHGGSRGDGGQVPAGRLSRAVPHPPAKAAGEEQLRDSGDVFS